MIIDLARLESCVRRFDHTIAADELGLDIEGMRAKSDISVTVEIRKENAKTDVAGEIELTAAIDCARCLLPVEQQIVFRFHAIYQLPDEMFDGHEKELAADDLDADALAGDELNLNEMVREQILLNMPDRVYCRQDCKGLCATCGENLNLIDCSCPDEPADPRWAALKNLN